MGIQYDNPLSGSIRGRAKIVFRAVCVNLTIQLCLSNLSITPRPERVTHLPAVFTQ